MSQIEISPGGVGFIRTNADKQIPGEPAAVRDAPRRGWFRKAAVNDGGKKVMVYVGYPDTKHARTQR